MKSELIIDLKKRICHISSVHSRYDSRIFQKECVGLSQNGFQTFFIVADGKENEIKEGVEILNVAEGTQLKNRLKRILFIPRQIEQEILKVSPDLVHFHDPELIPLGLRLKRKGLVVVADFHEDIPLQILTKPYLNKFFKIVISKFFQIYQLNSIRKLDAVIAATPTIKNKLALSSSIIETIYNFPVTYQINNDLVNKEKTGIVYIGGISEERGFYQICEAAKIAKIQLTLAGNFHINIQKAKKKIKSFSPYVEYVGFLNAVEVKTLLSKNIAGLVTLMPLQSYKEAYPIKLFEYMSEGIPVIASNFTLWKEIVEGNNCGICVDPENSQEIADAINFLVTHPKKAQEMGINGRRAVEEKYNWHSEEKKLITLYNNLLQ